MSANNLTNPPSTPNETTVAAMQEARQMAAKTPRDKKESTLTKLKKGQLAEQKLCDLRLAFDEGFAIIREAAVTPSSLLTELASVFHSNSIEPKFINSELVKKDIKLHKAEKEINATNAKRLKEALSENADLKSQLERMKQTSPHNNYTNSLGAFGYPAAPIGMQPPLHFMPVPPFGGINTPGFQNIYAPPNSFPGQNPVPPFPGSQSIHLGELLQRIMNLEAEVTKLQQRHISAQFQPQPQQFQPQFQASPMSPQPQPQIYPRQYQMPPQQPFMSTPQCAQKGADIPSMQALQEEGANKVYAFVEQKLVKEQKFTMNDLKLPSIVDAVKTRMHVEDNELISSSLAYLSHVQAFVKEAPDFWPTYFKGRDIGLIPSHWTDDDAYDQFMIDTVKNLNKFPFRIQLTALTCLERNLPMTQVTVVDVKAGIASYDRSVLTITTGLDNSLFAYVFHHVVSLLDDDCRRSLTLKPDGSFVFEINIITNGRKDHAKSCYINLTGLEAERLTIHSCESVLLPESVGFKLSDDTKVIIAALEQDVYTKVRECLEHDYGLRISFVGAANAVQKHADQQNYVKAIDCILVNRNQFPVRKEHLNELVTSVIEIKKLTKAVCKTLEISDPKAVKAWIKQTQAVAADIDTYYKHCDSGSEMNTLVVTEKTSIKGMLKDTKAALDQISADQDRIARNSIYGAMPGNINNGQPLKQINKDTTVTTNPLIHNVETLFMTLTGHKQIIDASIIARCSNSISDMFFAVERELVMRTDEAVRMLAHAGYRVNVSYIPIPDAAPLCRRLFQIGKDRNNLSFAFYDTIPVRSVQN